ncbi:RNA-binding protein [archaeon]|nr:MAG: RNA-binding protein [archaeon]
MFNNTDLGGRTIVVREDRKTGEEKGDGEAAVHGKPAASSPAAAPAADKVPVPNKVFIRNLAWTTNDTSLLQAFGLAGRVIEAKVNLTRTGRSQGTGVVEYTDSASATKAIQSLNGADLDGRQITVREYYEN